MYTLDLTDYMYMIVFFLWKWKSEIFSTLPQLEQPLLSPGEVKFPERAGGLGQEERRLGPYSVQSVGAA